MRQNQRTLLFVRPRRNRRRHRGRQPVRRVRNAAVVGRFRDPARMFVNAAEPLDKQSARQLRRLPAAGRRVFGDPVAGDVEPRGDPHLVMPAHIVEEPRQRRRATGAADQPAMQADGQHLRRRLALGVKHVEGVFQIGVKLVAGIEALRRREAHVVGVERIGHDQLRPARPGDVIGEIVAIGVGAVNEAAFLAGQGDRVDRRAPLIEAQRPRPGDLRMNADSLGDVLALHLAGRVAIVDPLEPVAGDLPSRLVHRMDGFGVARHRGGDAENRHRHMAIREHAV
jgi:hypothetical protein